MAAAGNNAFRQVGSALGPAVMGTLLSVRALGELPGRLAQAGVPEARARQVVETAETGGLGAVSGLDLGADTARALSAVSEAFLGGMRLGLIVSAALLLLAALAAVMLMRGRVATGAGRRGLRWQRTSQAARTR